MFLADSASALQENPDIPQTQEAEVLTEDPEPDLRLNLLNK